MRLTILGNSLLNAAIVAAILVTPANLSKAQSVGVNLSADEMTKALIKQRQRGVVVAPAGNLSETANADGAGSAQTAPTPETYMVLPDNERVAINISFDFDSSSLREDQEPKLLTLCEAVRSAGVTRLRVVGHTDSSGSAAYNVRLSQLRAEEVGRYLSGTCDIPPENLDAQGMGEEFPLDPADPASDLNRRVEFQVLG